MYVAVWCNPLAEMWCQNGHGFSGCSKNPRLRDPFWRPLPHRSRCRRGCSECWDCNSGPTSIRPGIVSRILSLADSASLALNVWTSNLSSTEQACCSQCAAPPLVHRSSVAVGGSNAIRPTARRLPRGILQGILQITAQTQTVPNHAGKLALEYGIR